jgi:hypothetical protein
MKHRANCSQWGECEEFDPAIGCEECQKLYEAESSYCPHCWKVVTNAAYFGKRGKSVHLDGKCKERHSIPASIFERTVDKPMRYPYPDGWNKQLDEKAFKPITWFYLGDEKFYPNDKEVDLRIIKALAEQNRLLKQLSAY